MRRTKKILSLLVVAMMLLAFVPGAMAASATLNNDATVTSYGEGVTLSQGVDLKTVLEDEVFYRAKDFGAISAVLYDEAAGKNNLDKVVKFTKIDSGIVYNWAEAIKVARMDLWILNCGGIGNYVVEYLDGSEWKEAASGNLDKNDKTPVAENKGSIASYHPIVFNKVIETTSLRFVVKSFSEVENPVAYISEAKLYDNNDINYGAAYYNDSTVGSNKMYKLSNPYLTDFSCSWVTGNGASGTGSFSHLFWPGYSSSGARLGLRPYTATTNYNNNLWYATTFGQSKVKVNKVGINLSSTSGTIKQFTVWAAGDNSSAAMVLSSNNMYTCYPLANNALKTKWQKVATIDCNITTDDRNQVFCIPNAVEAFAYMIEVTDTSDWTYKDDGSLDSSSLVTIAGIDMYTVRDDELSNITDVKFSGNAIAAGETLTLSFKSVSNNVPDARVYFALYENDIIKSVTSSPLALNTNSRDYSTTYVVPENAGENISVKAFYLDGKTLVPLLLSPVQAPASK